jgi:hypothetical protein
MGKKIKINGGHEALRRTAFQTSLNSECYTKQIFPNKLEALQYTNWYI